MENEKFYGLILAGGRGTRFWPRSRKRHAKQVLQVSGERTLIQATIDRLAPLIPPERIWILTNDFVREEIVRQLPEVPEAQIISEPAQRNTAPAVALAAHILESIDPGAVFGVFPSDAVIAMPDHFLAAARVVFESAKEGHIGVLGIRARHPDTAFGYIQFPEGTVAGGVAAVKVHRFLEKPNADMAKKFVEAGNYFWNAGMFFWKATTVLEAMRAHQPKTAMLIASLPGFRDPAFPQRLAEVFPLCENISVDYGIMENATNVVGVPCGEFGWNDVGSWNAVYDLLPQDAQKNAGRSEIHAINSTGNYIDCGKKLVALVDVKDLIVVDTPDALLIVHRDSAQKVGDLVKALEVKQRHDLL
jgi:mannose-1-phosphate guanylyltransferase